MSEHQGVILVLNSGSSSLKFSLYRHLNGDEQLILEGRAEAIGRDDGTLRVKTAAGEVLVDKKGVNQSQPDVLRFIEHLLAERKLSPAAVAHRVVHGGPGLREHQIVTPAVQKEFRESWNFAPLHTPPASAVLDLAVTIFPCPHFLCLDNAFHRTMPEVSARLPIPERFYKQGVQRYGFHGLSFESIVRRLGAELPRRAVLAHLGNGSSVTAVLDGKCLETSMGLTPTGGVIMGTRTGDLDPGVVLYLMRQEKLGVEELTRLLNNQSGMFAYSGGESDMQALGKRASAGDASADLAINAFCNSVRKFIGAYAALLGGIDLLVFSGGIGENAVDVRRRICSPLAFLGIRLDAPDGKVRVVPTEEERQMSRITRTLLEAL